MGYAENAQYFQRMYPYALKASQGTSIPKSVILAQWAHETGYGTSQVALNANNHGGIKYAEGFSIADGKYGAYAKYDSLDKFVLDYVRVMNLDYYKAVRGISSPAATIAALDASPYAEDPDYGTKVTSIFNTYGLAGYDNPQPGYDGGGGGGTSGGGGLGGIIDTIRGEVGNMSSDDMKKYAAMGLAVAVAFAIFTD